MSRLPGSRRARPVRAAALLATATWLAALPVVPALALGGPSLQPLGSGMASPAPAAARPANPPAPAAPAAPVTSAAPPDPAPSGGQAAPPAPAPPGGQEPSPAPPARTAPAAPAQTAPAAPASSEYLAPASVPKALRDPVGERLIDVATPFTIGQRWLEFFVTHRFIQPFNQGGTAHNLWGLDSGADVGLGFTYGVVDRLDLSVYRSSFQEDFELAAKLQVLQQAPGMPLSLGVRAGADMLGRAGVEDPHRPFAQLLLGRRLAPGWNVFVSPSWVHATPLLRNAWNTPVGVTAPLLGGWLLEGEAIPPNHALHAITGASHFAWHAAFTKPIGWHRFQILLGNSRATTVDQILGGDFAGGFTTHDLRLGFNLVRYFKL